MSISLNKIYSALFFILCLSLPFIDGRFFAVPNGINILLVLLFPFVIEKKELLKNLEKKSFMFFTCFTLFVLIKSICAGEFTEDISIIKKFFQALMLIILSFGLKNSELYYIKSGIIVGTFFAITYSTTNLLFLLQETATFNFSKGLIINETLSTQRLFIGLLCCISLILVLEKFFQDRKKTNLFLAILFSSFVFLISARIAIISTIITLVFYIQFKAHKKYKLIFVLSIFLFSGLVIISNPNLSSRLFHSEDKTERTYLEKIKTHEPRYIIWKESLFLLDQGNIMLGNGFENTQSNLLKKYEKIFPLKRRNWFIEKEFNTHNQFFDILLSQGVVGLLIFLLFFYFVYKESKISNPSLLLFITLILFLLIYNIFHRVIGVFIFAIIYRIIVSDKKT